MNRALFATKDVSSSSTYGATFSGDLKLNWSTIDTLMLQGAKFDPASSILLDNCDYDRLIVHWIEIKNNIIYKSEYDSATYLKLISNFRNLGNFNDENECYFQYRNEKRYSWPLVSFEKLGDTLFWAICGYGVRPLRAVGSAVICILLFALFYYWREREKYFSDHLLFSIQVFTYQSEKRITHGSMRWAITLEGIMGLVLFAVFIASLTSIWMKQ